MKLGRTIWVLFAAGAVAMAGWSRASDTFVLATRPLLIPERGAVESLVVVTPDRLYTFLPPPGWRFGATPQRREVSLQPTNFTATLTVKFQPPATNAVELTAEVLRERLAREYSGAVFLREYECYASALKGRAADFSWVVSRTNQVAVRVAVVPEERGWVEFKLTVLPGQLAHHNLLFGNLLTSFRVEPVREKR